MRVINLYAGPGTGKSTTAAALFAELKYRGVNCELVTEYAKDLVWRGASKEFTSQEYLFGKQHFRLKRLYDVVDYIVTDSPILMQAVYITPDFYLKSLKTCIYEAWQHYENLDVFLVRNTDNKAYNPVGRHQTEPEAIVKDGEISALLDEYEVPYQRLSFSRDNPRQIIRMMRAKGWTVPEA